MTPRLLRLLLLAAPLALVAAAPASDLRTMPVSELKPGMQATVHTVFEGSRVEEFSAEILGVMDDFLGPHQDLILARLKGEKVAFTGVAGGMSGSPVYIDGRLVGAISYRMGTFLKEPIAGITPIEYMLNVAGPRAQSFAAPPGAAREPGGMLPVETPLVASGLPASLLRWFDEDLLRAGLSTIVPGAAAASSTGSLAGQPPLKAGDAVAAQLVRGDISLAATGTVTLVDGDRVYAFGHPALVNGASDLPMARAEIYLTLASLQVSNKMPRVLEPVGSFLQSRLPAMTGVLGQQPRMIPVTIDVRTGQAEPFRTERFRYELISHRELTPLLAGIVAAASLANTPAFADEMTVLASGRIRLAGQKDVEINDLYSAVSAAQPAAVLMGRDVQDLLGAIVQNRFEQAEVRSIDLALTSVEQTHLAVVEGVYPSRAELEQGDELEIRVLIRPWRGEHYTRRFVWRVPEGAPPGQVALFVGGANLLSSLERQVLTRQVAQADTLGQVISLVNRLRSNNRLYMKIARRHGGAVVQNEILPALPPSVLTTLGAGRSTGEVTPLAETTIHEESIPLEQVLLGGTIIPLTIR